MILDKIEHAPTYFGLGENLKRGFEFIRSTNLHELATGRHEIAGSDVFALVSEYETKAPEDCLPEAHRIYTDIQFIISGEELIGHAALVSQPEIVPYQPEKDIAFFDAETTPVLVCQDMFTVFFPHDIHRPGVQVSGPENVKKIVIKVKL